MPMNNLMEYSHNYLRTSGSLLQFYRDKSGAYDKGIIFYFNEANVTYSFNFKVKITCQTDDNGIKSVEVMIPLK